MARHDHIPWEEYCYLDLKSNAQKQETSKRMEGKDKEPTNTSHGNSNEFYEVANP